MTNKKIDTIDSKEEGDRGVLLCWGGGALIARIECWPVETMIPIQNELGHNTFLREQVEMFAGAEQRRQGNP